MRPSISCSNRNRGVCYVTEYQLLHRPTLQAIADVLVDYVGEWDAKRRMQRYIALSPMFDEVDPHTPTDRLPEYRFEFDEINGVYYARAIRVEYP